MGNIFCPPPKSAGGPCVGEDEACGVYGADGGDNLILTVRQLALSRRKRRPPFLPLDGEGGDAENYAPFALDFSSAPLRVPSAESVHLVSEHRNASPFKEYEVLEVMGSGSMGEVSKVRRKPSSLNKRRGRGGGGLGLGLTRGARSCSSLRSVDEISALKNFLASGGRGGGSVPPCRRRTGAGTAAGGLTEKTATSEGGSTTTTAASSRSASPLPSAAPSREASFRCSPAGSPGRGRSRASSTAPPPSSSAPPFSTMGGGKSSAILIVVPPAPSFSTCGGNITGGGDGKSSAVLTVPPPEGGGDGKSSAVLTVPPPEGAAAAACGNPQESAARGGSLSPLSMTTSFRSELSSRSSLAGLRSSYPWGGDFGAGSGQRGRDQQQRPVYYALKSIHLKNLSSESFTEELRNEISILESLDHPHIVRAIETYEHRRRLYLVLELCSGGDLYARDPYSEKEAARIVGSVLSAVAYMHRRGVVHRDLKYENVMFVSSSPSSDVKLIDFGLSRKYRPGDPYLKTGVGTIYSMAPEVFQGEYTSQADVWGVGVMAYMLLSSHLPFYGKNRQQIIGRIVRGQYHFRGKSWTTVSDEAKRFVASLLRSDPERRPAADGALTLPWLNGGKDSADDEEAAVEAMARSATDAQGVPEEEQQVERIASSLQSYAGYGALKKLALMVIAHRSTSAEIGFLRQIFHKLDQRRAGVISKAEFKARLSTYGYSVAELDRMFAGMNLGCSGLITYTEFLAATLESTGSIGAARLAEAFDHFDRDGCGYISVADLRAVLGEDIPRAYVDRVIDEADLTEDHRISFEEFLSLWEEW